MTLLQLKPDFCPAQCIITDVFCADDFKLSTANGRVVYFF